MKRVISYSLWGDNPKYTIGAIKNAELALTYYPDFECWFYVDENTVPKDIIDSLKNFSNTKIIFKNDDIYMCKPNMWRFEAIDDPEVEIMMCRDTDSRFLLREKLAVDQWLESGKLFHIMRDHPFHGIEILGGMFGTRKVPSIPSWIELMKNCIQNYYRDYDQYFLRDYVYPLIKDDVMIHASHCKYEGDKCLNFPIDFDSEGHFVGQDIDV